MTIKIETVSEPDLDFGQGRRGVEPRRDMNFARAEIGKIKLGFVGAAEDVAATKAWLESLSQFRPAREANAERYRDWPGTRKALGVDYILDQKFVRTISDTQIQLALRSLDSGGFETLLKLFDEKILTLLGDVRPDCIVICLSDEIGDLRVENPGLSTVEREALRRLQAEEESDQLSLFQPTPEELAAADALRMQADELLFRTFYRALKARAMLHQNPVPLQVIRRGTVEKGEDKGQSHATRAWNLGISLLYKSGQMPWRPANLPENTCFIGISFHHLKRRSGGLVYASLAQAISTEFEPFALTGASIDQDQRRDKRPYLNQEQARNLLNDVLREYEARAGVNPDRIVFHKTSTYQPEEITGFLEAAAGRVPACDLIWMRPTSFRLLRKGYQEPWRGTLCTIGEERYLFTSGFIPWWREYPGPHIPAPIEFGSATETDVSQRVREILALSKMNWNSSDGVSRFPVTISFAKKVGEIMAELPDGKGPNPSYRFYM